MLLSTIDATSPVPTANPANDQKKVSHAASIGPMPRCLRVGPRAGTPVEDLGVEPDELYRMGPRDLAGVRSS